MVRSDKHPLPILHLPLDSMPSGSGGHAAWDSWSTRRGPTDTGSAGTISLWGALQGACNVAPIGIFIFVRPHPRHVPDARRQLSGPVAPQVWLPGGTRWCGAVRKGRPGPGPETVAMLGGEGFWPPPPPPIAFSQDKANSPFAWSHSSTGSRPASGRGYHTPTPNPRVLVQGPRSETESGSNWK